MAYSKDTTVIRMTLTKDEAEKVFGHLNLSLDTENTPSWELKAKLFEMVGLEKPDTPKEAAVKNTQRYRQNKKVQGK